MSVMKAAARRPESGTKPWPRSSTFGRTSQNYFYAMGFAQGETLENLIKRSGHLEVKPTLEIAAQVTKPAFAISPTGC
jgi:hypothetical protein